MGRAVVDRAGAGVRSDISRPRDLDLREPGMGRSHRRQVFLLPPGGARTPEALHARIAGQRHLPARLVQDVVQGPPFRLHDVNLREVRFRLQGSLRRLQGLRRNQGPPGQSGRRLYRVREDARSPEGLDGGPVAGRFPFRRSPQEECQTHRGRRPGRARARFVAADSSGRSESEAGRSRDGGGTRSGEAGCSALEERGHRGALHRRPQVADRVRRADHPARGRGDLPEADRAAPARVLQGSFLGAPRDACRSTNRRRWVRATATATKRCAGWPTRSTTAGGTTRAGW